MRAVTYFARAGPGLSSAPQRWISTAIAESFSGGTSVTHHQTFQPPFTMPMQFFTILYITFRPLPGLLPQRVN
jgi:hypothetical protein